MVPVVTLITTGRGRRPARPGRCQTPSAERAHPGWPGAETACSTASTGALRAPRRSRPAPRRAARLPAPTPGRRERCETPTGPVAAGSAPACPQTAAAGPARGPAGAWRQERPCRHDSASARRSRALILIQDTGCQRPSPNSPAERDPTAIKTADLQPMQQRRLTSIGASVPA